jgi:predicted  nucleic acid-binding Zn-ribbon protein
MWNGLDKLIDLQKLDVAIAKLEAEAQAIPPAIQALETKLVQARAGLDAAKASADQLLKERRSKERDLEEVAQGAKKKQVRLYEIKTNEEYTAVLKEIAVLKEKSSGLETEILEFLEKSDGAAKVLAQAETVFRAVEAVHQKERGEKEAQFASVKQELDRIREARLDAELLQQYTRVMRSRGVVVVPVKDGSCGGCGVALPPQQFVEVRRNDRMFTCPSCSRILYYAG